MVYRRLKVEKDLQLYSKSNAGAVSASSGFWVSALIGARRHVFAESFFNFTLTSAVRSVLVEHFKLFKCTNTTSVGFYVI